MSPETLITLAVLSLVAIVAMLAFALGTVIERMRSEGRDADVERRAFDEGADVDDKMRRLGERARRFGR